MSKVEKLGRDGSLTLFCILYVDWINSCYDCVMMTDHKHCFVIVRYSDKTGYVSHFSFFLVML